MTITASQCYALRVLLGSLVLSYNAHGGPFPNVCERMLLDLRNDAGLSNDRPTEEG